MRWEELSSTQLAAAVAADPALVALVPVGATEQHGVEDVSLLFQIHAGKRRPVSVMAGNDGVEGCHVATNVFGRARSARLIP